MPGLGMNLGMHQAQRIEQRQALVQQQVMLHPGEAVEQFRTDEEKKQVSQYEILKQLQALLEKGEYFDPEHFSLEINREIFGHPLEARLGNFGRDIEEIVRFYGGSETFAQSAIALLGSQKDERKDIPGQIVHSWKVMKSSPYFEGEKKNKKILELIQHLKEKEADIAQGLAIISQSAEITKQKEIVDTSLKKVEAYAQQDIRIIPFAHSVVFPLWKAIGTRNEQVTNEDADSLYTQIVDNLYMLDRDLRVTNIENIAEAVRKNGLSQLLTESRLPLPLQVYVNQLVSDPENRNKIIQICNDVDFHQGRELKRKIYRGFASLEELAHNESILVHITNNVQGSKSFGSVLGALSLVSHDPDFVYPFDLQSEKDIVRNLRLQLTDKSLKRLNLGDATLEKYITRLESDERFEGIGKIITTLAGYSHFQNEEQISLLREIVGVELDGKFLEWRYSHDKAKQQLAVLDDKIDSWRKNSKVSRLIGELDALKSHIDSIKNIAPKLIETYKGHYEEDLEDEAKIRKHIEENEQKLKKGTLQKHEQKELGFRTALLREQRAYIEIIQGLQTLTIDNYQAMLQQADNLAKKRSKNPLYNNAIWIKEVLDQPVYREARKISVIETDDLEALLRMGEKPIPHCQDWRANSTLNESLLSFAADANKKLYHVVNGDDKPVGMSLVRLLEWDCEPTLLIENLYANEWSNDYGIALVGSLADKAASINAETGKSVRLAAPYSSGHAAHNTNIQVKDAFEKFSDQYKVYIHEGRINITPPLSKNTDEYWDCGIGKIKSGRSVKIDVHYITFGEE
ncbi:hypothetical protein J4456_05435 [Candidatus Pacearchaeota archaeon]|nr:hypothetical protein [Candidatus Pacearchaeota archaeon]